jgi:threonyl-tRNA synthetase
VVSKLRDAGINADADLRNEKISYKVREHSVAKVPILMAVGQREVDEKTVALRRLGSKKQQVVSIVDAIAELSDEIRYRGQAA